MSEYMLLARFGRRAVLCGLAVVLIGCILVSTGRSFAVGAGYTIAVPDNREDLAWTHMTLDGGGNPVVTYHDWAVGELWILHCNDPACSGSDDSIELIADGTRISSNVVLDASGYPVVAYAAGSPGELAVVHCNDANCSGGDESVSFPDQAATVDGRISLQIDSSGFPVLGYVDSNNTLRVVHCNDPFCAGSDESITLPASDAASDVVLELDDLGNLVVAYLSDGSTSLELYELRVLHCDDPFCAGGDDVAEEPSPGQQMAEISMKLDSNGYPVVSFVKISDTISVLRCDDANCSGQDETVSDIFSFCCLGNFTSLALDANDIPVVSFDNDIGNAMMKDPRAPNLIVTRCGNPACSAGNTSVVADRSPEAGSWSSLVLDANENPVVSYVDRANNALKLLHCGDPVCTVDADADGCTDLQEFGSDETTGGLRDPKNPNDFYDVPGLLGEDPDGIVDLSNDILGVINHYSPSGAPPYDIVFDRGPTAGPNPWNMTAPDGVIDLSNDVLGVINQYLHDCR